jgi:hypothetical protein
MQRTTVMTHFVGRLLGLTLVLVLAGIGVRTGTRIGGRF